jgi:hypothetical protein
MLSRSRFAINAKDYHNQQLTPVLKLIVRLLPLLACSNISARKPRHPCVIAYTANETELCSGVNLRDD